MKGKPLKYIKQRGGHDCGIAALAMATGNDYEAIYRDLGEACDAREGINDLHLFWWCWKNGWAYQQVWRHEPKGKEYPMRANWPLHPFAPSSICQVEVPSGYHYVALDFDGRVYDPYHGERQTLIHPDYKSVSFIMGLWNVGGVSAQRL